MPRALDQPQFDGHGALRVFDACAGAGAAILLPAVPRSLRDTPDGARAFAAAASRSALPT